VSVKKTSLYLPAELDAALARRAADEGLSKAELIRRTLEGAVTRPRRPKLSIGTFESTDGGMSADVDKALRETGFGRVERRP
jgi:hypothetical protein